MRWRLKEDLFTLEWKTGTFSTWKFQDNLFFFISYVKCQKIQKFSSGIISVNIRARAPRINPKYWLTHFCRIWFLFSIAQNSEAGYFNWQSKTCLSGKVYPIQLYFDHSVEHLFGKNNILHLLFKNSHDPFNIFYGL